MDSPEFGQSWVKGWNATRTGIVKIHQIRKANQPEENERNPLIVLEKSAWRRVHAPGSLTQRE
jgi:hypothetical protein